MSKGLNVLVVEDDATNSMLLEAMLLKSGIEISGVQNETSFSQAMDSIAIEIADVIVLDLNVPDCKGLEAVEKIVQKYPQKSVLVITSQEDRQMGPAAIAGGADDYLVEGKIDVPSLSRAIRCCLACKQVQKHSRYSQTVLETLAANLPQRIVMKNSESVIIYCNARYAESLGLTPEQVIGKTDYDLYSRQMADRHVAGDKQVIASGHPTDYFIEYTENDRTCYVRVLKVAVADEAGQADGILCVLEDFTERILIQESLRQTRQNYSRLLNKSIAWYNSWKSVTAGAAAEN